MRLFTILKIRMVSMFTINGKGPTQRLPASVTFVLMIAEMTRTTVIDSLSLKRRATKLSQNGTGARHPKKAAANLLNIR